MYLHGYNDFYAQQSLKLAQSQFILSFSVHTQFMFLHSILQFIWFPSLLSVYISVSV